VTILNILIVDDRQQDLYLLNALLQGNGFRVITAAHGQEALDIARATPPDVIVSDILMPVMDGFTLCREWMKDEQLQRIPFVFYSATYTEAKDIELAAHLGAARFILKPSEPDAFIAILRQVLHEYESGRLTAPSKTLEEEPVFLKEYNERLVRKLEHKLAELDEAHRQLAELYSAKQRYATELEEQVAARTAELQVALEKAQEADRLKSQFISNINHELRTPLTVIQLNLGLLSHGRPENRERYLATLNRETERLQTLVEEVLDLSQLDLGKTAVNLVATDLNQLMGDLVIDRGELAADKGLTLDFEPAVDLPLALADPQLLFQVLTNLLANAVNYTPPGGAITLRTASAESDGQSWLTASVVDTGPGISEEDKAHIFERFQRGRSGRESGVAGTGLGLAICQAIMIRHGGQITVESLLGQGSTFTIWLLPAPEGEHGPYPFSS
jgi:signal transduction histidine kinase